MINSNDLYEFIMKEHKNNNQISLNFNRSVSYRMLENEVERCCLKLSNEGIKEGSRVALRVVHSYSLIYLILALWKNNNQVMLLDPRLKENEVNELIHIAKPNFYIESIQQHSLLAKFKEEVEIKLVKHYDDSHSDHVSLILSSSGSTGIPKIIGRTPESIIEEIKNTAKQEGSIRKDDTVLILSSLHHSYGLITALLHSLYSGATVTFSQSNQKNEIINTLINKKVSALFAVPAHYELLTNSFEQAAYPRLRIALSAGDILKEETFDRFHDQFGIPIGLNYGMTEVGMISIDFLGRFPQTCGPNLLWIQLQSIERSTIFMSSA
ncbi:AMP-binding protein [Paenibacillus filicis]|uniref:AMP-binding protein n=1 Tax=Paenibacillus gyeongsangnamensis TaxID=3388067 RepID=A0ABT4Q8V4_9BACL|nr:AMP-binding protein [Paenibacillus filicis]MCZ8513130.1 AMP-binding protein [Paenibacillus filicis]